MDVALSYELLGERLLWSINVTNMSDEDIDIEDFGIPLMLNSFWTDTQRGIYEDCVSRHSFTALDGSYI